MPAVVPFHAGRQHMEIPGRLMSLSGFSGDVAQHFFTELAPRFDVRRHLPDISVPTRVLVEEYDWVCPAVVTRALADGIPNAWLVEIPKAGHVTFSEKLDAFLTAAREFLSRVPAVAPAA